MIVGARAVDFGGNAAQRIDGRSPVIADPLTTVTGPVVVDAKASPVERRDGDLAPDV